MLSGRRVFGRILDQIKCCSAFHEILALFSCNPVDKLATTLLAAKIFADLLKHSPPMLIVGLYPTFKEQREHLPSPQMKVKGTLVSHEEDR